MKYIQKQNPLQCVMQGINLEIGQDNWEMDVPLTSLKSRTKTKTGKYN